ncbi:hypothetical protein [Agrobacterium tumefaciens]|uniref:hypothetical protein n=1 Tax=Agrobacterium tumefaciens TaxID=358 RepID=UPI001AEE77F2|nr:hypothetical protein [Agrobacterium tumefaciens]
MAQLPSNIETPATKAQPRNVRRAELDGNDVLGGCISIQQRTGCLPSGCCMIVLLQDTAGVVPRQDKRPVSRLITGFNTSPLKKFVEAHTAERNLDNIHRRYKTQ